MEEKTQLNSEVSVRYSKALFKIANEQKAEKSFYEEVCNLLDMFNKEDRFMKVFCSPLLSSRDQLTIINNIFSVEDKNKINVNKYIFTFFRVLAKNGRLKALIGALHSFRGIVKSMQNEVNVYLTSAIPLTDENLKSITKLISNKIDKDINIISNIDKKIIGGIILQFGANLIDASIRNKILKLNNINKGVN